MPLQNLQNELQSLKTHHHQILKVMQAYLSPDRQEMILQNYMDKMIDDPQWTELKIDFFAASKKKYAIIPQHPENFLQETLQKIQMAPQKKLSYLQAFFDRLPQIEEEDKSVLLDNFKSLPEAELEKELTQLQTLFGEEEE